MLSNDKAASGSGLLAVGDGTKDNLVPLGR
jgi:hypothetical protein